MEIGKFYDFYLSWQGYGKRELAMNVSTKYA